MLNGFYSQKIEYRVERWLEIVNNEGEYILLMKERLEINAK